MAIEYYKKYEVKARAIGDPVGEGIAIGNQGSVYLSQGDTIQVIDLFFERSLKIAREVGDRRGEGIALGSLGRAYAQLGEKDHAIENYKQRLKIAIELDDNEGLCSAMYNIGLLHMQKRQVQDAILIWANLYTYAREKKLDHALQRLAKLAPKVGLPEGLDGWERLLQDMHKSGNMKNFVDDLMSK
jgi:tetratricopeptide (TPR) repeat protein